MPDKDKEQPRAEGVQSRRQAPPPIYRSTAGEAELQALYDRVLASLSIPHEEVLVRGASLCRTHGFFQRLMLRCIRRQRCVPSAAVPSIQLQPTLQGIARSL